MSGNDTTQTDTSSSTPLADIVMPAGGLFSLAQELFPEDRGNDAAIAAHVQELFDLNRDRLQNDASFIVGQIVRVPAEKLNV